jgi:hypothetical protein
MKRRLNVELVSFDKDVSGDVVVLGGWVIEMCSLLASAQTAGGDGAPVY